MYNCQYPYLSMYNPGFQNPCLYDKGLQNSLYLIRKAVAGETKDRKFYQYLIDTAPTREDKEIIASIRDDELKHYDMFREIYKDITGQYPVPLGEETFEKPSNFLDGIRQALFGELSAVEMYRKIYYGLKARKHRDMLFEIISDELKHSAKYNYIYTKNLCSS